MPDGANPYAYSMPETVESAPDKSRNSFMDLLASLTGKLESDGWDDSALADDVTTISYEDALRSARRARKASVADGRLVQPESQAEDNSIGVKRRQLGRTEKKAKGASITIRVTAEEHAQLQARAVAAGMSVSAYLRSCIFEAEALRTEVREAVARIESAQKSATADQAGSTRPRWGRQLIPAWLRGRMAEG